MTIAAETIISTDGGDYAEGNIDKRQGIFVGDNSTVTLMIAPEVEIEAPAEPACPPRIGTFVGRASELDLYTDQLASAHLAVIIGMAGIGKTALAAELATLAAESAPVFWHSFHEAEGIDSIVTKLAGFLARQGQPEIWRMLKTTEKTGGKAPPPEEVFDNLIQRMRGRGYLLCLDDFQFVDQDPLLKKFLQSLRAELRNKTISLIITSRRMPKLIASAEVDPLPGLSVEDSQQLMHATGVILDDELLAALHDAVEGNAMLLTLGLGLLDGAADPARLIARLAEAPDIAEYMMDEVRAGLSDEENAVMGAIAALLGEPGSRDAIEAMLDRGGVYEIMYALRGRSLLQLEEQRPDDTASDETYAQHAIVREFYYNKVLGRRDRPMLHQRAAAYYADTKTPEYDALKAARHYECAGEYTQAADMVSANVAVMVSRGQARPLRQLLERFTQDQLDIERWIAILIARGQVYMLQLDKSQALDCFQDALRQLEAQPVSPSVRERKAWVICSMGELLWQSQSSESLALLYRGVEELDRTPAEARNSTHKLTEARLRLTLGAVLIEKGQYSAAIIELETCLSLLPEQPSQWHGTALMNLGNSYHCKGDLQQAKRYYAQALAIYKQFHNYWRITSIWLNLALVMETDGQWANAAAECRKALDLSERLGNITDQTVAELNLSNLLIKQGEDQTAYEHLQRCLALARDHSMADYIAAGQSTLADFYVRLADWEAAHTALADAEQAAANADATYAMPEIQRGWAQLHLARGDKPAARAAAERALQVARTLEDPREEGISLKVIGQVQFAQRKQAQARESFTQCLALLAERDAYEAARSKSAWGELLLGTKQQAQGKALLEEAKTIFTQLGAKRDLARVDCALSAEPTLS